MVSDVADPQWYKDAVIYELHVRAYKDSDGDGIGDFRGLTENLEYLQQLGITAIWLLPFYPSPGRDDGYDIADYRSINPSYGTMRDFRAFMKEAKRLGLRVITELVVNHTSDQHEWFKKARVAPEASAARNVYVWSDTPEKYTEARVIFQDTESSNWSWDPVAKSYFWHRFYSHQPDLNFENPAVQRRMFSVLNYWMKMGVSGMRLDAVPYLYEEDGTNCENLPKTHEFLKLLRKHMDTNFPGSLLLSEANQWPEQAVAYFGDDEHGESHMAFHFPLMPRLFMALQLADSTPIIDILEQTPAIPEASQWAIFLRNHDELTLEMVTDEERDYMYRMYAHDRQMRINLGIRRRLASLMNNDRRKIELMHALLFSLPGTPVLYYGDEIGMGDNIYLGDRNGVRTPMQWSSDRNAGFSSANSQQLYLPAVVDPEYHFEAVNVEAQLRNPDSLLWWMKRIIALRKNHGAFSRGSLRFLHTSTPKGLAFVRKHGEDEVLVVANLSRYPQHVTLEDPDIIGKVPVEMSGSVEFPVIGEQPYTLSLAPFGFYWFSLVPSEEHVDPADRVPEVPVQEVSLRPRAWATMFDDGIPAALLPAISKYIHVARWFGGKARTVQGISLLHSVPVPVRSKTMHSLFIQVAYTEGEPDTYFLPVALDTSADEDGAELPNGVIAKLNVGSGRTAATGLMTDALEGPEFPSVMLAAIGAHRSFASPSKVELTASPVSGFRKLFSKDTATAVPRRFAVEQSNTSVLIGDDLIFKFYRRISPGANPDYEIGKFLSEKTGFANVSPVAGAVELVTGRRGPVSSVAILQKFIAAQGDAWQFTLDTLRAFGERADALEEASIPAVPQMHLLELAKQAAPDEVADMIGPYLESARLLGERTAQLHEALATGKDAAFAPESFTSLYQRSLYQGMRNSIRGGLRSLRTRSKKLDDGIREDVEILLEREPEFYSLVEGLLDHRLSAQRIRIHGDYHLGQVLYTGTDFVIIDFEGEPARPLSERRIKRSPLRDVAGMVRSFHYAASVGLLDGVDGSADPLLWSKRTETGLLWYSWVSAAYLNGYRTHLSGHPLVPQDDAEFRVLLDSFMVQKAIYEIEYEMNNRPQWVGVPVKGLLATLGPA